MAAFIAFMLALASLLLAAPPAAAQLPVVPYDSLMEDRVNVDGYVDLEEEEYPARLVNPATGITLYWGFDDSCIYVALTSRGQGWLGIGFGSPTMHESNMIIGFYSDDSSGVVNHLGQQHVHSAVAESLGLLEEYEIDFDDETGLTTLEFIYPLNWQGLRGAAVSGLEPGDTYDLILARNAKSTSLAQAHAQRAQLKFRLAENPRLARQQSGEK